MKVLNELKSVFYKNIVNIYLHFEPLVLKNETSRL